MILQFINWINFYLFPFASISAAVVLFLFLATGLLAGKPLMQFFMTINKRTWLILIFIFFIGLCLRFFVSPHQLIQAEDEMSYMATARGLLDNFSDIRHERAMGWSLILAMAFKLFGLKINTAFYTSSVLGSLTVLNVFFIAFLLFKKEEIAIYSSSLFTILPLHIFWSGSAETNIPSLFFLSLGIFFSILYFKKNDYVLFRLTLIGLAFASLFRPENYLIFCIFLILVFLLKRCLLKNYQFIVPLIITFLLIAPCFFETANFYFGDNLGINGVYKWELHNLIEGAKWSFNYLFSNYLHSVAFSFLCIAGFVYLFLINKKMFFVLFFWFLLFYIIYFSSWFSVTEFGGRSRIFLNFYLSMVIAAGYAFHVFISYLKNNIIIITTGIIMFFLIVTNPSFFIGHNKNYLIHSELRDIFKLETEAIKIAEKNIQKNCLVVATFPTMLTTTKLDVVDVDWWIEHRNNFLNKECILFFQDYMCLDIPNSSPEKEGRLDKCNLMKNYYSFDDKPIFSVSKSISQNKFGFYMIP